MKEDHANASACKRDDIVTCVLTVCIKSRLCQHLIPVVNKRDRPPVLSCLRCMETYVFEIVLLYLLISDLISLIWLKRSEVY